MTAEACDHASVVDTAIMPNLIVGKPPLAPQHPEALVSGG
jgi:hypothetical protein